MNTFEQTHELPEQEPTGQRAFILGNGPSLAKVDLNLLKDEIIFAGGRIHTYPGYDEREWHISEYFLCDKARNRLWPQDVEYHVKNEEHYPCWLRQDIAQTNRGLIMPYYQWEHIHVVPTCGHNDAESHPPDEWHLPHLCTFGGSVAVMLQVAFLRGYDPVYVLGCDLGYKARSTENHFSEDYQPVTSWATQEAVDIHNLTLLIAHQVAYKKYYEAGRRIFNATPGGELEVYPRIKFERVPL